MDGYYKPVIKILKKYGFSKSDGGKGSHEKWVKGNITLIVQRNMPSRYSANGILKDAGLSERF